MYGKRPGHSFRRMSQVILTSLLLGLMIVLSACGGDPQAQQQASQSKTKLDSLIQYAQQIGVPAFQLHPILNQKQQLESSNAPFALFNDASTTVYYKNQANSYANLLTQTQTVITTSTAQSQSSAENAMQNFQTAISRRTTQHIGNLQPFTSLYNKEQAQLTSAKYPKDYSAISQHASTATDALSLMGSTYMRLTNFKSAITSMQKAHVDVTALQAQYDNDMQTFNKATTPGDFKNIGMLVDAQYQQAVVNSIGSLPYVGQAKLNEFQTQLGLMKLYDLNASTYQKRYTADQAEMQRAKSISDYLAFSSHVDADIAAMHNDLIQGASAYLIGELDKEARAWGNAHLYHNKPDGKDYILDSGYTSDGIGYWLNQDLDMASTPADFQAIVDEENIDLFNLHMMKANYTDKTPYNQVHATDMQLLSHYHLQQGQVMVISFTEQVLRLYQDGKLIRAFHVTTGRVERPSLPGVWPVLARLSPTEFVSSDPPSSPYYYAPTPIHYAMMYHQDGFFVHDAYWRNEFGPGTQFPHPDSSGNASASNGSHGCVNVQEDEAAWLYSHTDNNTTVVIY